MFWLVLTIAGHTALIAGPMPRAECDARQAVMSVDLPAMHACRCERAENERN